MNQPDRNLFERVIVDAHHGTQRKDGGMFRGQYCDQSTDLAWRVLCEYLQRQQLEAAIKR